MKKELDNHTAKLNATELAKLEKDGLDVVHDIERFAEQGFLTLSAADIDRLKWLGLYVQRPKNEGNFMLRVKIPGGVLNSRQARVIAEIAQDFGRNVLDITTRHAIQFHWIALASLPAVLRKLESVGLSTLQAAGDCPRNIVANPLDGVDPDEFLDTIDLVDELNKFLHNNRDFSNLPRKFKIAISGGLYNSVHAEINDLSFVPAVKEIAGQETKGFNILVGGGLSSQPRMAVKLDFFVIPEEIAKVTAGVASIFRDYGYREKRNHARLKFLLDDWGKEKFQQELLKLSGSLLIGGREVSKGWNAGIFKGVHKQKQAGLNYFGITLPSGRISPTELLEIARLTDEYGDGHLRTTNSQDIMILNIADDRLPSLEQEMFYLKQLSLNESFNSRAVACTGNEFCPFAVVETKARMKSLADYLDQAVGSEGKLRIHMSGCPNSCGQPQIADIGLQGTMTKIDGKPCSAFEIWVGGRLGAEAKFAAKLAGKVTEERLNETIAKIIKDYHKNKLEDEAFADYIERSKLILELTEQEAAGGKTA